MWSVRSLLVVVTWTIIRDPRGAGGSAADDKGRGCVDGTSYYLQSTTTVAPESADSIHHAQFRKDNRERKSVYQTDTRTEERKGSFCSSLPEYHQRYQRWTAHEASSSRESESQQSWPETGQRCWRRRKKSRRRRDPERRIPSGWMIAFPSCWG